MRGATLIAGLLLTAAVSAQELPRFDFRGMTTDSTAEQHRDILQKCEKYMNLQGCKLKDMDVAGVLAFPEAMFRHSDGKLDEIRGSISRHYYDTLNQGFIAKWGAPTVYTEETVQNGYGAELVIPMSVWKFAEGDMTLIGPSFRGQGSWHFRTHQRQAYLDGLRAPKADF